MKEKLISALALSSILLGMATPALAEENTGDEAVSKAKVTFKADEEITGPENPGGGDGGDGGPGDGGNGGSGGPLSIDYVSHMSFGEQTISGSNAEYHPLLQSWRYDTGSSTRDIETVYIPQFAQITDKRGENSGWTLKVERTQFATASGEELKGAEINVENAEVVKMSDIDDSAKPTGLDKFTIPLEGAVDIVTAAEDQGMATWSYSLGKAVSTEEASKVPEATNENITLSVPGTAKKIQDQEYTSNITWTLVAGEL